MGDAGDNPGVRFPPPLLYALAVIGGYLLNRRWPLPLPVGDGVLIKTLAWALTFASLALAVTSIGNFRRSRTSIVPVRPATALVIAGPYRFTRNPIYIGFVIFYFGLAIMLTSAWILVLLIPVLIVLQRGVVEREEAYLQAKFGEAYRKYQARVPRWL